MPSLSNLECRHLFIVILNVIMLSVVAPFIIKHYGFVSYVANTLAYNGIRNVFIVKPLVYLRRVRQGAILVITRGTLHLGRLQHYFQY
jgi:hypothetical protein